MDKEWATGEVKGDTGLGKGDWWLSAVHSGKGRQVRAEGMRNREEGRGISKQSYAERRFHLDSYNVPFHVCN